MVDMKAILHWGTHIFYENISFLDFPDLDIAENSVQKYKKYDIVSILRTAWEISPIHGETLD